MDTNLAAVLVVALIVIVLIAAFAVYAARARFKIKAPGASAEFDGSNVMPPGIKMDGVTAEKGSVKAEESLQRGIDMKEVKAGKDVIATIRPPDTDSHPKA
jgi:hypothetical protein